MDVVLLIVWHLGALHPVEKILTFVLAFGPFVFLGFVIWWRKRQDEEDEPEVADESATLSEPTSPRPPVPGS
ncbi:MAG: hypothetical protein V9G04_03540 [Nocardioides sp.]